MKLIKLAIFVLAGFGVHNALAVTVSVLNETFEAYSVGAMPVGWSGTSVIRQANDLGNTTKYVAATSTSTSSAADPLGTISFSPVSGEFSFEYRLRGYDCLSFANTASLYNGSLLVVKTMNVNNSLRVDTTLEGILHNFTGSGFTSGIGTGGWFSVRMECSTLRTNENLIVYVDGAIKKILTVPGLRDGQVDRAAFGYLANVDDVKIVQGPGTFNMPTNPDLYIEHDHVVPFPGKLSPAGIPATTAAALFEPFLGDTPPEIVTELGSQTTNGVVVRKVIFRSLLVGSDTNLVYAIIASPAAPGTYPGVMWLHGGGGYAELDKAVYWAEQGYVSIVLDQPGIAEPSRCPNSSGPWKFQAYDADRWFADPDGRDSALFDGVVSELQAFALLRSLPNVNSNQCGITGISWGGYSTTIVSGLLGNKVKAAFSLYGCGFYELASFLGAINPMSADQRANWVRDLDAGRRADGITAAFFMAAAVKDAFFYPPAIEATLNEIPDNKNLVFAPINSHSLNGVDGSDQMATLHFDYHLKGVGGALPEVSVVSTEDQDNGSLLITFQITSDFPAKGGKLYYSAPGPAWPDRVWIGTNALSVSSNRYEAVLSSDAVLQDGDWYVMASDNRPATASSMLYSAAPGSIKLAKYAAISADTNTMVQISNGITPTGNAMVADPVMNSNTIWALWTNGTNISSIASCYVRFRMDLRSTQNNVSITAGGVNNNLYNPSTGSNDFQASGSGGGFLNTLQGNTLASFANSSGVPENGWVANDGAGLEEINWLMVRPDDSSTAASLQAIALGFLWTDTDANGKISSGDVVALKYGVTSADFSEIDTVDELDIAVGRSAVASGGPQTLVATARDASVKLDWHDSFSPSFASYTVYRSEESGSNYVSVASGLTQSTYTNSGLVNGIPYYFVVTETDTSAVESGYGNEASATPVAQLLISYNLSFLDDTDLVNSNQFNTTMTYPNSTGGFIVTDPSDNNGRMDRFVNCDFNASSYMLKGNAGKIYSKSANVGFSGSDVLSSSVYTNAVILWKNSGTYYYNPKDVIVWFGRLNGDQNNNATAFNDIAYGFKLTDSGAAGASAGDIIELVGIVYSTGTGSVFGKTADELTSLISALPPTALESWRSRYGITNLYIDTDNDGLENLGEYAFGGSPIDVGDLGVQPRFEGTNKFIYELVDDTNLTHEVITTTNLVTGGGSISVTLDGSGNSPTRAGFKVYTNTVDTSANGSGFIRLKLSY